MLSLPGVIGWSGLGFEPAGGRLAGATGLSFHAGMDVLGRGSGGRYQDQKRFAVINPKSGLGLHIHINRRKISG